MSQRARATKPNASSTNVAASAERSAVDEMCAAPVVIVTTPPALLALVRGAVNEAMNDVRHNTGPMLLDRASAARALGVGTSTLDRFRKAGMKCVWVGDAPRFIVHECVAWLQEHRRVQKDP